jgi:hypothetical protein
MRPQSRLRLGIQPMNTSLSGHGYDVHRTYEANRGQLHHGGPSIDRPKPAERVNTDRRDALKLCCCLRNGDPIEARPKGRGAPGSGAGS